MYLLDTNAISEMRKIRHGTANKGFTAWLAATDSGTFYTSAIVVMELERGILRMERKDPAQGQVLRAWYSTIMAGLFAGRILPLDERTAAVCAALHIPDPAPENDAWIASTAKQYGLVLVTRNTADFQGSGVRLLNPFEAT